MGKWIFEDIQKIRDVVLYGNTSRPLEERIADYNDWLRRCVKPELYVKYIIWQHDVYVDLFNVIVATKNVYHDVSENQVAEWVKKNKEEHQMIV